MRRRGSRVLRATGSLGTLYEIFGLQLFIDGIEVKPTDGKGWASADECKNAADSSEIAEACDGLPPNAWREDPA